MAITDGLGPSTLQFVLDALRADMSIDGRPAVLNPDGTAMTVDQIATAANLTTAQIIAIAGGL